MGPNGRLGFTLIIFLNNYSSCYISVNRKRGSCFFVCVQRKCAERDGLRAVCKVTSVKAPGPGGFTDVALHAALSLAQHHSARWPESAWLTDSYNSRNPGNNSSSGAEFRSLNERFSMRLWRAKRRQTAYTPHAQNAYAGHKRKQNHFNAQAPKWFNFISIYPYQPSSTQYSTGHPTDSESVRHSVLPVDQYPHH